MCAKTHLVCVTGIHFFRQQEEMTISKQTERSFFYDKGGRFQVDFGIGKDRGQVSQAASNKYDEGAEAALHEKFHVRAERVLKA